MIKVRFVKESRERLLYDRKFKEAHKRYSGKWNRERNKLRKEIIRKKYWK